jgi:ArsR family transcriptional regulator
MKTCFFNLFIVILLYNNMGITKSTYFTVQQNTIAAVAKALGHPARVAILDYLLKVDGCICGDIVAEVRLAQPTVSQHLKELKLAGLIKGEIEGKSICYCIDENGIEKLHLYTESLIEGCKHKKSECC